MKTIIKENTWLPGINHGWGNGYVIIPPGHKLHGKHYDNIKVDVHGGLTFSELIDVELAELWELDKEDIGGWLVGFDTAHYRDDMEHWPMDAVQAETDSLKSQLEAL